MNHRTIACVLAFASLIGFAILFPIPARAMTIEGILSLSIDHFDLGAFGLSEVGLSEPLQAPFRVAFVGGGSPDPAEVPAFLQDFDLTIGNAHWDETMPYTDMRVLAQGATLLGFQVFITVTKPDHADLRFLLPASPGVWEAHDIVNQNDNGKIGGTYSIIGTVAAIPEPTTLVLLATGLAGVAACTRKSRKTR